MSLQPNARPVSRALWHVLEPIHGVVYFAPEVRAAAKALGLEGFWMGYFAFRAAPLGPVPSEVVTAAFFNFHPEMVRRAIPDAWARAEPTDLIDARRESLARAFARLLGEPDVTEAAALVEEAARSCSVDGRSLFAAHVALPWPDQPVLRLWHGATLLREHRGDGHVAANVAEGVTGLMAHVMFAGTGALGRADLQPNRGWSDDEWEAATDHLVDRGWLSPDGGLTADGRAARQAIEDTTDRLAAEPWDHLGPEHTERLRSLLLPLARAVVAAGGIPVPNPMGVPAP